MQRMMCFVGVGLAALIGCTTTEAQKPCTYSKQTPVKRPEPKPVVQVPARPSIEAQSKLTASLAHKAFRVLISAKKDDGSGMGSLEQSIVSRVQEALCSDGFEVVASGPAELNVDCKLQFASGASRGSHVTCRGSVELSVRRTERWNSVAGRKLNVLAGIRRFDAQGVESRTETEAVQSFGDKLCAKFTPWIRETCLKTTSNLEMCDVVIVSKDGRTGLPADYPTQLSKTVLAINGVYGCSVANNGVDGVALRAVVLYDKKQFPDGLLNRLCSIEKLKLVR